MKIIIIRLGRIGDMILSTPLFRLLKDKYPDLQIDVVAGPTNHHILKDSKDIDNILVFDKSPFKFLKFFNKFRKVNYDYLIEPKDHYSTESYLLSGMIKADKKIGFKKDSTSVFDLNVTDFINDEKHFMKRMLCSLKAMDIEYDRDVKPILNYGKKEAAILKKIETPENYVVVNPSSSQVVKKLSPKTLQIIIDFLKKRNENIYLVSSPEDKNKVKKFASENDIAYLKTSSINETFPVVENAKLLISADTALVHIASAYNTPLIGFYLHNPVEIEKFKPLMDNYKILSPKRGETFDSIDSSEIKSAVDSLLEPLS